MSLKLAENILNKRDSRAMLRSETVKADEVTDLSKKKTPYSPKYENHVKNVKKYENSMKSAP